MGELRSTCCQARSIFSSEYKAIKVGAYLSVRKFQRLTSATASGTANFTSIRRDKGDKFEILRWKITRDDGVVLDLASDDPRASVSIAETGNGLPEGRAV